MISCTEAPNGQCAVWSDKFVTVMPDMLVGQPAAAADVGSLIGLGVSHIVLCSAMAAEVFPSLFKYSFISPEQEGKSFQCSNRFVVPLTALTARN